MIRFLKNDPYLLLSYSNEYGGDNWVKRKMEADGYVTINKTFKFTDDELFVIEEYFEDDYGDEGFEYNFVIGELEGVYYRLKSQVFGLVNKMYIHKSLKLKVSYFNTLTKSSILDKLDKLIQEPLYIGGTKSGNGHIPIEIYESLLKYLPNTYETKLYSNSRIESIFSSFIKTKDTARSKYNSYLNKKLKDVSDDNFNKLFSEYEIDKLSSILSTLERMLENEVNYSENQWQEKILKILLVLFPKYIAVFKEVKFEDIYTGKKRRLDYVLVDYLGHIDIIEIKKPMDANLVSKNVYRDNHIPKRELSGTIMQIEKYIYYLNKWGIKGEQKLTKKYSSELPKGMDIKITNPNGIIIMGRESGLTSNQLGDLEIIKRKYKNVIDIITYDDLIKRLKIGISQMKKL